MAIMQLYLSHLHNHINLSGLSISGEKPSSSPAGVCSLNSPPFVLKIKLLLLNVAFADS